ncbi:endonuclease/exonuclease/phosphatase family protein [Pyxidicoccus sp. MSG2]|uniref:endonuclease/exonuclease/phosphatase family protein n=1 Tax=Pyxidicoccus sp. MSG2 TaxID=2996790 RepID=UPI00226FD64F|nr:endonuclease/exonuclease/phosphatase family protein [Pyxidicoccus sp. MSG2]MCY1017668.1 endonuclease [Pyxidicoccus sp. MSG2]
MKKTLTSLLCAAMSLTVLVLACGGEDPVPPQVPLPLEDGGVLWADCDAARGARACPEGASCRFVEYYDRSICVPACDPQAACQPSQAACCVGNEDGGAGYCVPNEVCATLDAGTEDAGSDDAGTDAGVIPVETDAGDSKDAGTEAGTDGGPKGDAGTGGTDAGTGGTDAGTGGTDAGTVTDAGTGGTDAGTVTDAGTGGTDAGTVTDAGTGGTDAGTVTDAGTGGTDAGTVTDAGTGGTDAGTVTDAGTGGTDAGTDAGTSVDAGTDAGTEPLGYTDIRIMAANITSGNGQDYDLGHGIRLMQGVKPDVILVQEFNYLSNSAADMRSMVDQVGGTGFSYFRETGAQIPNGIISRWPIIESGEWTDPEVSNRDFAWARIDIPGPKDLWAISVHLLTSSSGDRNAEANSLVARIKANIPAGDYLAIGGDFNTDSRSESCLTTFKQVVDTAGPHPVDKNGKDGTNAARSKPYDHVLVDSDLRQYQQATVIRGTTSFSTFTNGLVLDSRVYTPISEIAPAVSGDSGAASMQHMAVVKDFHVPNF